MHNSYLESLFSLKGKVCLVTGASRLENFGLTQWNLEIEVGLTGAFLCSKIFGTAMAVSQNGGSF